MYLASVIAEVVSEDEPVITRVIGVYPTQVEAMVACEEDHRNQTALGPDLGQGLGWVHGKHGWCGASPTYRAQLDLPRLAGGGTMFVATFDTAEGRSNILGVFDSADKAAAACDLHHLSRYASLPAPAPDLEWTRWAEDLPDPGWETELLATGREPRAIDEYNVVRYTVNATDWPAL